MKSLISAFLFAAFPIALTACSTPPLVPTIPVGPTIYEQPPVTFDVRSFGAKGDGKTLDTASINAAIDAASAAGGGTVYFRAGTYPSYSIHLKSNIALYLDQGATLLAAGPSGGLANRPGPGGRGGPGRGGPATGTTVPATQPATTPSVAVAPPSPTPTTTSRPATRPADVTVISPGYDHPESIPTEAYQDFGHSHFRNSLIWGENLENISILGPGRIDGNGLNVNAGANTPLGHGNKILALKLCRNVTLRDFTMFRGGHFCILATGVDNFTLDNLKIDTNRDGIDIVSCKNVRLSNCLVNSPVDDGICLKSDLALGEPRPCERISITNCQVSGYDLGTVLDGTYGRTGRYGRTGIDGPTGRIKFGTESNGGFKNITISNCTFEYCRGLAIEAVDGAIIEDVTVTNITMRDVCVAPIFIRLGNRAGGPAGTTPVGRIRGVDISNVTVSGNDPRMGCIIAGLPGHPIENVRLSNIRLNFLGGGTAEQGNIEPLEKEATYPEPGMFNPTPGSVLWVRHAKNIEVHGLAASFEKPELRPAIAFTDVAGADFENINIQRFDGVPVFLLKQVTDFAAHRVRGLADVRRDVVEKESLVK